MKLSKSSISSGWLKGAIAAGVVSIAAAAYNSRRARQVERRNPPIGEFVEAEGVRLHYLRRGNGRTIVLLHGNGVMLQDWTVPGIFDTLAQSHDVIAFDRPGFGYSSRPRTTIWTPRAQASAIAIALTKLGISEAIVVGHSFGTQVALALALNHAPLVSRLVLLGGYLFPTFRPDLVLNSGPAAPVSGDFLRYTIAPLAGRAMMPAAERQLFTPAPVDARWKQNFPIDMVVRPSQVRATAEDFAVAIPGAASLSKRYGELDLPITVAAGPGDKIVGYDHTERFHAEVPTSRLVRVDGAGHMVHYTATDLIVAEIVGPAAAPPATAGVRVLSEAI